jgi:hypothetical protein
MSDVYMFDRLAPGYDRWFDWHPQLDLAELAALRRHLARQLPLSVD